MARRAMTGRSAHRRRSSRRRVVLVVGAVIVLLVVAAGAWVELEAASSGPRDGAVIFKVVPGESTGSVLSVLARDGVLDSALAFRVWSVVHGEPTIRPGTYDVARHLAFSAISADLESGPNVLEVDVSPGTTVAEVADQLATAPGNLAQRFEAAARTGAVRSPFQPAAGGSLEGLIGTGTYRVLPHEAARTLLSQMVARFDDEAASVGLSPSTSVSGVGAYGIVTVASISQKEGYFNRYLGDVARVVYNRLAAGMNLDMTSTVLYSLGQDGGPVTQADERDPTPYNTYLHAGLTPTPICTPSRAALAAAVAPPKGAWLYFELVTAKNGRMVFSATYTQQVAAERQAAANDHPGTATPAATVTGT